MKTGINALICLFFMVLLLAVLWVGVWVLQEPKCATATPKEQLEMRCQKALSHYRG